MTDTIHNTILPMTDTTVTPEDYTGEDGLLYCGSMVLWIVSVIGFLPP